MSYPKILEPSGADEHLADVLNVDVSIYELYYQLSFAIDHHRTVNM